MRRALRVITPLLVAALVLGACGNGEMESTDEVGQQAQQSVEDARAAAQNAWASLRTDAERLVDEIQTRDDAKAKEELLNRCRDALEKARKAESGQADRIAGICDRIQNTDVNADTWDDVKRQISELNVNS